MIAKRRVLVTTFDYLNVEVIYDPDNGNYNIIDKITSNQIGYCTLLDGPGWVYKPMTMADLMAYEVYSIGALLMDLDETLTE